MAGMVANRLSEVCDTAPSRFATRFWSEIGPVGAFRPFAARTQPIRDHFATEKST